MPLVFAIAFLKKFENRRNCLIFMSKHADIVFIYNYHISI